MCLFFFFFPHYFLANELRLSRDWCTTTSARNCEYSRFIGTVVVEIFLALIGWIMSLLFVVWIWKGDYHRPVGLCSGKLTMPSFRGTSKASSAVQASFPEQELEQPQWGAAAASSSAAPSGKASNNPFSASPSTKASNNPFAAPSSANPFDEDADF